VTAHLRLYNADGVLLPGGIMPDHEGLGVQEEHNGPGSLSVNYSRAGLGAALINSDSAFIGVVVDGAERPDRYLLEDDGDDPTDTKGRARMIGVGGRGVMALLEWAEVYPKDYAPGMTGAALYNLEPLHAFADSTPGAIMATFIDRAQQRSYYDGAAGANDAIRLIDYDFTSTHDSAGNPWPVTYTVSYEAGLDLLKVLLAACDNRMVDARMQGFTLRLFVPDVVVGSDRPNVILRAGREVTGGPRKRTRRTIRSHMLAIGDEGAIVERVNTTARARYGRREGYEARSGVTAIDTLTRLADAALEGVSDASEGFTVECILSDEEGSPQPGLHYNVGERIRYDQRRLSDTEYEPMRVRTIATSWDKNGNRSVSIELNDLFVEASVRLQRKVDGIVNGSSSNSRAPQNPGDVANDRLAPKVPAGCAINTGTFLRDDGSIGAAATISWAAVTQNVDGTVYDDAGNYLVSYRTHPTDALLGEWTAEAIARTEQVYVDNVNPGWQMQARVHTIDSSGNVEVEPDGMTKFTYSPIVTVVSDTVAPPVPSTPDVDDEAFPGGLKVTWDGLGSAGETMPLDLRVVEVHAATESNFVPSTSTLRDTLRYGGGVTVIDSPVGVVTYIVLVAVDNTGNRSNPSTQVSGEGRGLDAAELAAEINAAISQAGADAGAAQATAEAAQASAATAIANAATGQSTANAAQSAAAAAQSTANAAQAAASNAASAAQAAQDAADAAALAAQDAGNHTYFQADQPTDASDGDLWIETDNGNLLRRLTDGIWVVTTDQRITDAQAAAAAAQAAADSAYANANSASAAAATAQARADSAFGAAGTAQAAANAAQSTASSANAAAATAQAAAVAAAADAAAALNANPNLYKNSSFEVDKTWDSTVNVAASYPGPALVHGTRNLRVTRTAAGTGYMLKSGEIAAADVYGKGPITVSWTERNSGPGGLSLGVIYADTSATIATSSATGGMTPTRRSLTFTPDHSSALSIYFAAGGPNVGDWTEFDAVKVEVGGKATAWSLNPQEAVDAAAAAKAAADAAQTTANNANNAAAAAQSSANTAIANAATAQSTAASAQSAASAAQGSANTALTNAGTAQSAATAAQTAANAAAAQAAAALAANPNVFVGSSFEDPTTAVATAVNTGVTLTSDTTRAWHGTRALKAVSNDATGDRYFEKTVTVEPNTDYAVSIYAWVPAGTTNAQIPANGANGNLLWAIDYANGTNVKIGSVSLAATNVWQRATTTIKTGAASTVLTLRWYSATGGIWFDAVKVEKGTVATAWSLNPQEAIDAAAAAKAAAATAQTKADQAFTNAQTAQDAATAASTAAGAAQSQATTALNTANGKGKTYFQGTAPVGPGLTTNDVWFNTSADNQPSSWNGSSWVLQRFGNSAILAGLDAGKITVGTLSALVIGAKSISVEKLTIGSLSDSLILNGSFEDPSDLPVPTIAAGWNTYSGATRVSGYSRSGSWSISAPVGGSAALESDRFTASPGDIFYLAAWAYFAAASGGFYLRMQWLNAAMAEIGISDAYGGAQPTSTAYALYQGNTVAAPAGTAYARVQVYSTNTTAIIDDIACNKVIVTAQIGDNAITAQKVVAQAISSEKLTVGAFGQSLVRNGSFEDTGSPIDNVDPGNVGAARWSQQASAGSSAYTEANTRGSGQRTLVLYTNTSGNQSLATSDYFPVLGGGTYFGSAGACQTGTASGGFYFRVHWYDSNKNFLSYTDIASYATLPTQASINGNRVTGQVVAPSNAAYANVRFYNSGPSVATYMIVDDVTFQQVTISAQIADGAITAPKVNTTEFNTMIGRINSAIITEAMIASATVTRLTAGNLSVLATLTAGGKITTGGSAGRVEWDASGIRAYAADGVSKTVEILSATGSATFTGTLRTGFSGRRIELINNNDATWLGLSMNFYSLASMAADPPRVTAIDTGLDIAGYDPMQLILDGGARSDIASWQSSQVVLAARGGAGLYGAMSGATYQSPAYVVGSTVTIDPKNAAGTWGSYDHTYHELNMYDVIRFQGNVNSQFGGLRFYNYNGPSGELKQWERRRVSIAKNNQAFNFITMTWEGFFTARPVVCATYEMGAGNVSNDVAFVYSNNTTNVVVRSQDVDNMLRTVTVNVSVIATL
jgi:hypothetical protein